MVSFGTKESTFDQNLEQISQAFYKTPHESYLAPTPSLFFSSHRQNTFTFTRLQAHHLPSLPESQKHAKKHHKKELHPSHAETHEEQNNRIGILIARPP